MKSLVLFFGCFALGFCATKKTSEQPQPAITGLTNPDARSTVLVFDQGFDTQHEVFKNKIAATYTLDCPHGDFELLPPKLPKSFTGSSFAKKKAYVKEHLAARLKSCQMKEGLEALSLVVPEKYLKLRSSYNTAIRNGVPLDASMRELQQWLDPHVASGQYHGTATAGIIAANNDVNLVLVGIRLATSETFAQFSTCPLQADIDALGKIFEDKEVLKIFVENDVEKAMRPIFVKHRVDYANLSAGVLPRKTLENFYARLGCRNLNLKPLYQVFERLAAVASDPTDEQTVAVMAAGNENTSLNSASDGALCPKASEKEFLVGSIGKTGQRSAFSNYGRCVRFYAPGEQIVVPFVHDFYVRQSGTSFSAPFVTRLLTTAPQELQTASKRIQWLTQKADANGFLK